MTKNVIVHICGTSSDCADVKMHSGINDAGKAESVEVTVPGLYFYRNSQHVVLYQDTQEQGGGKNMLKMTKEWLRMKKSGVLETTMEFQPGKEHLTDYRTPYGTMKVQTVTQAYELTEGEDLLKVMLEYGLTMNGAQQLRNRLEIEVRARDDSP